MKTIIEKNIWSISSFLHNNNYNFNKEEILKNLPVNFIDEGFYFVSGWVSYSPTPLLRLNKLKNELYWSKIKFSAKIT